MGKKGAILGIFCAAAVMLAGCSQKPQEKNGGARQSLGTGFGGVRYCAVHQ